MNKLDKETSTIVRTEKTVEELMKHDGWKIVDELYKSKIKDLESILNVSGTTAEQVSIDVKSRVIAMNYLVDFMTEIQGMAQNSQFTNQEVKREALIFRK